MSEHLCLAIFTLCSLRSVVNDIRAFRVEPQEIAFGIVAVIIAKASLGGIDWTDTILGGGIGLLSFAFIARFSQGRLGYGDVWFSTLVGFAFGFLTWDFGMLAAAILGLLWVIVLSMKHHVRDYSGIRIPFVPFMFAGSIAVSIYRGLSQ